DAAAPRDVDHRETIRVEDVAGDDHVRSAEEDDDVAVAVGRRLVQDFDALAVEIHVLAAFVERFSRPRADAETHGLAAGRADALQHLLGGKNRGDASEEIAGQAY